MPKLAKKMKKNDTVTIPSLYESPPASVWPWDAAMTIQQMEHAAAEVIMTFRRPKRSMTKYARQAKIK
jgi:hypothetical protein